MRVYATPMKRLATAVVLLGLTQCNTALRDAMARAEAAHARGDHFGEAVALRDACRADRSETEVCRAAKEAADEIIGKQLHTASGPCNTEPVACLAALEVLSPFAGPADPRLLPYFDRAGDMLAERCEQAPLDSPEDAVFRVRCAEAYKPRVPTTAYGVKVGLIRQRAAAWLDQQATARARTPGVAWLYESLSGCLGGEAGYAPRIAVYRQAFEDAHAVRLEIGGQAPYELCGQLQRELGSAVRCEGRSGSVLPVSVDAWVDQMTDSPIHEVRTVEVLDHTERWENPDYRYAQGNVRHARNRHEDAEGHLRLARVDCDAAESALARAKYCYQCWERTQEEQTCNRKRAMDDLERKTRSELSSAQSTLSNTPAYLTRDVYRRVNYRNVQHRFSVPWHVRVAVSGGRADEARGVFEFESTEREGVPAANVSYLPYSEPTQAQRRAELGKIALEKVSAAVNAELDARARERLAGCPAPEQASECQVEAALLARKDPVAQFAADVGARLDGRTGTPWPRAACAP